MTCHLRPTDRLSKASRMHLWSPGEDNIQVALVLYSTFEQLDLPGSGPMDKLDVQKYYERQFTVENDIYWALKDIPGLS